MMIVEGWEGVLSDDAEVEGWEGYYLMMTH